MRLGQVRSAGPGANEEMIDALAREQHRRGEPRAATTYDQHGYPRLSVRLLRPALSSLPMLHLRLTALGANAKEFGAALGLPAGSSILTNESVPKALSSILYDTALIADQPGLAAVSAMAGADRLIFGSDWPFAARLYTNDSDPQPALSEVFSTEERDSIERSNAARAFEHLS